jgi:hypothetical protein
MQGSSWLALLQRIPPEQSDNLLVITNNGTGISVKGIVRAEKEYIVVRGRLTGSAEEGGGFFFLPYDQIQYLGFQKAIKENVILSMYEGEPAAAFATAPQGRPEGDEQAAAEPAETPEAEGVEALKPATPGKAALLERLRARRAGDNAKP